MSIRFLLPIFAALPLLVFSQEKEAPDREEAFAAMLTDATLTGSWVPVLEGGTGEEKRDSYEVVKAVKVEGDRWQIFSRMSIQGQEIVVPIPVIVKWAGDTAVLILDEAPAGPGRKYSARVLFHDDRYAGSWWGENEPGGLLSGVITR